MSKKRSRLLEALTEEPKPSSAPAQETKPRFKTIIYRSDHSTHKQLKQLSVQVDKPIQHLIGEGLNLLFHQNQLPPIAPASQPNARM